MNLSYTKISLVSVAAILGVFYVMFVPGQGYPQDDSGRYVVTLGEEGFSPGYLKIKKGETVVFKTSLDKHFWPASDLHPTHTMYSDFDPREPVDPGSEWEFVFDREGEWRYHDHLSPYFVGIILVDGSGSVGASRDSCRVGESKCWENMLLEEVGAGVEAVYSKMTRLYETGQLSSSCHSLTHDIGLRSFSLYKTGGIERVVFDKAGYCAGGFFHGFMEAFIGFYKDEARARAFCDEIGEELRVHTPDARLSCFHGIGHGALETSVATSLTDEEVAANAIDFCVKSAQGDRAGLYRCISGVFNGIANFYIRSAYGFTADKESALLLCEKQIEPDYIEACYGNMNSLISWMFDGDFAGELAYLDKSIADDRYAIPAVSYLAALEAVNVGVEDPVGAAKACRGIRETLRLPCIGGIADGFMENGLVEREHEEALAFCETSGLRGDEMDVCLRFAFNFERWYSADRIKKICAQTQPRYSKYCKETQ